MESPLPPELTKRPRVPCLWYPAKASPRFPTHAISRVTRAARMGTASTGHRPLADPLAASSQDGETPLHWAVISARPACVSALVTVGGADMSARNKVSRALHTLLTQPT